MRAWNGGLARILQLFALVVFLGLSALAVATLFVSRGPIPAELSGSVTPPEFAGRTVGNVLANGDFVTRAADGDAHVLMRFNSPETFRKIVHAYRSEVFPQYRIGAASVQHSDDGVTWTNAAEAGEVKGKFVFDVENAGTHRFWRMNVVKSGDAPEVIFGQIYFIHDSHFVRLIPLDAVWLGLLPAAILLLVAFRITLSFGRVFTATAVPVVLFVLLYSLGYTNFHTVTLPDSGGYLQPLVYGTFSTVRNSGYPRFLLAVHNAVGLDNLAWVQLGIGIACYLAGAFLLAVRFGNKWVGSILVLAMLLQGTLTRFAPDILTEALFMAGLGLFSAALGALAWRPDKRAVIAASVGIVLATLAKTLGVVLVVPALLLIRFLPKGSRLAVSGAIVACGLGAYGLMAFDSYMRTGIASPESFAGYALLGNVGGMLDDTSMPPSELTRDMISAAAPVIEQRPSDLTNIHSLETLDRYVDVTVRDFNIVIWQKLMPVAAAKLGTVDQAAANSFFLRFGLSSIRANPLAYLRHVSAHFYGMWRDLAEIVPLRLAAVYFRGVTDSQGYRKSIPASILSPYPSQTVVDGEVINQSNLPLLLKPWSSYWLPKSATVALGALAFFLSLLVLVPGRLAHLYRTEIMIALSLNAYFGAHVLLQVSLERYASVGIFAAIFLAASFVITTCHAVSSSLAAWASMLLKGRSLATVFGGTRK
jgi:hypothetical protein